jgi:predicted Zn-dependent protease
MKMRFVTLFALLVMALTGCSSDYLRDGYQYTNAQKVTKIPEIKQQPATTVPKKAVNPYKPAIKKYTISSSTTTMNSQNEVDSANNEALKMEIKNQDLIDVDPYDSIPESGSITTKNTSISSSVGTKPLARTSSPAVKSLMARARADLSIGKTQSAISKLERGLRIESQNPEIWHLLAKAQYDQSNHQQAITMAKKSIRYSDSGKGDEKLIAQNWTLIKKSGEKSDDAIAIKEALDYFKVNP